MHAQSIPLAPAFVVAIILFFADLWRRGLSP
jgi:hypothetical protein